MSQTQPTPIGANFWSIRSCGIPVGTRARCVSSLERINSEYRISTSDFMKSLIFMYFCRFCILSGLFLRLPVIFRSFRVSFGKFGLQLVIKGEICRYPEDIRTLIERYPPSMTAPGWPLSHRILSALLSHLHSMLGTETNSFDRKAWHHRRMMFG